MIIKEYIEKMNLQPEERIRITCAGKDNLSLAYVGEYVGLANAKTKKLGERSWIEIKCEEIMLGETGREERSKQYVPLEWITEITKIQSFSTKLEEVKK